MKKTLIAILLVIVAALGGGAVSTKLGGTPGNLASDVATTSTVAVGDRTVSVLFATSTNVGQCAGRTVSTQANAIIIQFSEGTRGPNATTSLLANQGHVQAASTTVNYDSSVYGCGAWRVISSGIGSTTLTITETK